MADEIVFLPFPTRLFMFKLTLSKKIPILMIAMVVATAVVVSVIAV